MHPAARALLLALVVLSTPALVGGAPESSAAGESTVQADAIPEDGPIEVENTTNKLVLPEETNGSYAEPTLDLGATAAADHDDLRIGYHLFVVEERFDDLNEDERRAAIDTALEHIEERMETLVEREQAVVRDHAEGDADAEDVLRTLAMNREEALELQDALSRLDERSDEVPDVEVPSRSYAAELEVHVSPVRERLAAGLDDETASQPVYLETSPDGVIVATVDGGDYLREATRYDNRDPDSETESTNIYDVYQTMEEQYPWAFENRESMSVDGYKNTPLTGVEIVHPHGEMVALVDDGSGAVYREVQVLSADRLPTVTENVHEDGNRSVTITRTPVPGPALVTVSEDGEPIEATVTVNGTVIGETDASGERWVVLPGDEFELTVGTADDRTVVTNVSVRE